MPVQAPVWRNLWRAGGLNAPVGFKEALPKNRTALTNMGPILTEKMLEAESQETLLGFPNFLEAFKEFADTWALRFSFLTLDFLNHDNNIDNPVSLLTNKPLSLCPFSPNHCSGAEGWKTLLGFSTFPEFHGVWRQVGTCFSSSSSYHYSDCWTIFLAHVSGMSLGAPYQHDGASRCCSIFLFACRFLIPRWT